MISVDAHVHFFTRSLVSDTMGRWISIMRTAALAEGLVRRDEKDGSADPARLVELLDTGLQKSPSDHMNAMDNSYGPGWAYVPLMLDLEYALDDELEQSCITACPERKDRRESESEFQLRRRVWEKVERAWKTISGDALETSAGRLLAQGSFEIQKKDLSALKASAPERIFPFLCIDPRRQHRAGINAAELTGDCVGPGRPFAGIKLYSSTGFSPTDPALAGPGGLYSHCSRRKIPITVHFSPGGFATPLSEVQVRGDIFYPLTASVLPAEEVYPGGVVSFGEKMTPGNIHDAVAERQMILNHPLLWEKVLALYPKLIINFAHTGGEGQISLSGRCPGTGWTSWVLDQARRYRGVYMDLSAYSGDKARLRAFLNRVRAAHPRLRRKILYGSDYFLTSMNYPEICQFREMQKEAAGNWWTDLSARNARKFLSGGIDRKFLK